MHDLRFIKLGDKYIAIEMCDGEIVGKLSAESLTEAYNSIVPFTFRATITDRNYLQKTESHMSEMMCLWISRNAKVENCPGAWWFAQLGMVEDIRTDKEKIPCDPGSRPRIELSTFTQLSVGASKEDLASALSMFNYAFEERLLYEKVNRQRLMNEGRSSTNDGIV